jgi:hypothetical protein
MPQPAGTYPHQKEIVMGGDLHRAGERGKIGRTTMKTDSAPRRVVWALWASGVMLIAAGCADPPAIPYVRPPVLAGQARIWFYRDWLPSESLNLANMDVNGVYFGSVANGSAFYRDVPAGHYHIAPVSYNRDINQDRDVDLAAGQQLYVKILSSQSWDGACRDCVRDTFYAWVIPPQIAEGEIARVRSSI